MCTCSCPATNASALVGATAAAHVQQRRRGLFGAMIQERCPSEEFNTNLSTVNKVRLNTLIS